MSPASPPLLRALEAELRALEARAERRTLVVAGGEDFTSNDYLGLAADPRVAEAMAAALGRHGAGSRAARLLGGTLPPHLELEARAAQWLGSEATLLFPSGYHANLALLTTLAGPGDLLACDAQLHASLIDGARLARARRERFAHDDPDALAALLARHPDARRRLVVVESVDSMDGTLAPLAEYARVCAAHDAWLLVDEAHAAGLFGPRGEGLARELPRVLARVVTGGKALGVAGALVAAARPVIEVLLNRARPFVFTTAPPPALAAGLSRAISIVEDEPERRERAHAAARALGAALGLAPPGPRCPIVPIRLGSNARALAAAERVRAAGFEVRAVRPPSVPEGTSRLRLVCRATHDEATVERLARALRRATRDLGPALPALPRARPAGTWILGTDTGVGKTVACALLLRHLARAGREGAYLKPVQTGPEDDTARVRALCGLGLEGAPEPLRRLALAASVDQAAAAEGVSVRAEELAAGIRARMETTPGRPWLIEGAGGLLVPLSSTEDQADLVRRTGLAALLVARSGLGTLNHTRLTLEALAARAIRVRGLLLVGAGHPANEATLAAWAPGLDLGRIPPLDPLTPAALDAWSGPAWLDGVLA